MHIKAASSLFLWTKYTQNKSLVWINCNQMAPSCLESYFCFSCFHLKTPAAFHSSLIQIHITGSELWLRWYISKATGKRAHLQSASWTALCLAHHLRPVCRGKPYEEPSARDNIAPRILWAHKPLHHDKAAIQGGDAFMHEHEFHITHLHLRKESI